MKKFIAVLFAVGAVTPAIAPAVASASVWSVQTRVARQFDRQVRNNASLRGFSVISTSVTCRAAGGGVYQCLGKATDRIDGQIVRVGIYITATNYGWHTRGSAFAL